MRRAMILVPFAGLVSALQACAIKGAMPADASLGTGPAASEGWHDVPLPGKRPTRYAQAHKDGRVCIHARADGSASMWRRKVNVSADQLGRARWNWRVDRLNAQASVADVDREDAVARVIFAFDGDRSRLSARNRAMFDLARALTGEEPPYATLMYVWSNHLPVGTVVNNRRTDRIRKLVIQSGAAGVNRWQDYERDIRADYERVFGAAPGALKAVALMTDTDNTASEVKAWYGPVVFEPRAALRRGGGTRLA